MPKKIIVFALFVLLGGLFLNFSFGQSSVNSVHAANLPPVPGGLKNYLTLGLSNGPGDVNWMTSSGAAWDARYQYLAGGVNTPNNWKTWQDTSLPPGQFVLDYMSESSANGYTPVLTWYQMAQSLPGTGSSEDVKNYNNLNNASTMKSYFSDFKLLLDKAKAFGKPVIIHVEPDLWGFLQQRSTNPNSISASVASSGYSDVAGYANTVSGFAQALVGLRNKYAPNALLAYHISEWASSYGDVGTSPDANFNVSGAAQQIANFYVQTGANFDLMFYDPSDRDAALYASWGDPYHWWDVNNTTYPNFNRFHQFISLVTSETNKRGMLWQVPIGNTLYRSMNNTQQHWQDNRVQYYLNDTTNKHLQDLANSGVVGILFGAGDGNTTSYGDGAGDGITNPAPINGNTLVASYSDDDGGNLRLQAKAYYTRGALTLPSSTTTPTIKPTNTPVATATPTKTVVATATPTIKPTNTPTPIPGGGGTGLNGAYFFNKNLTGTASVQRVDATINFDWGNASPATGIPADNFSVRWTGQVKALSTGAYTFCVQTDDGVRLWVNNVQLVNNWVNQGNTEKCGNTNLTQNQLYSIKMEYYEATGGASAKLLWSGPSVAKQVIPQSQLYTGVGTGTPAPTPTVAPTATPKPTTAAPTSWVLNSTVSGTLTSGSITKINAQFVAPTDANGSYILDTEVYNLADNSLVGQWYSTKTLTAGQNASVTNTITLVTGNYIIKQGVFSSDWTFLAWKDVITFQIK